MVLSLPGVSESPGQHFKYSDYQSLESSDWVMKPGLETFELDNTFRPKIQWVSHLFAKLLLNACIVWQCKSVGFAFVGPRVKGDMQTDRETPCDFFSGRCRFFEDRNHFSFCLFDPEGGAHWHSFLGGKLINLLLTDLLPVVRLVTVFFNQSFSCSLTSQLKRNNCIPNCIMTGSSFWFCCFLVIKFTLAPI